MFLVKESSDGFSIYFNTTSQEYSVYRNGKFFIGKKYKYSDVKSYVE